MPSPTEEAKALLETFEQEYTLQMCMRGLSHIVRANGGELALTHKQIAMVSGELDVEVTNGVVRFFFRETK